MAWIESHQELRNNPKTRKLARSLNISIPAVIGHLQCLWWWATDYAQNGDLSRYDANDIADAMMWEGDPDILVEAMITIGFIDEDENGRKIHDWYDYAGRLIEKRKANCARSRRARDTRDNDISETYAHGTHTDNDISETYAHGTPETYAHDAPESKPYAHATHTIRARTKNVCAPCGATVQYSTVQNKTKPNTHPPPTAGVSETKQAKKSVAKTNLDGFAEFWAIYPKKRNKGDAEKAWKTLSPSRELMQQIANQVAKAKTCDDWTKENGRYIPYPASWLRARGWEDELPREASMNNALINALNDYKAGEVIF